MARRCDLTASHVRYGHNVSHSNRKTSRRFVPNLQHVTLSSDVLGRQVPLRVSTRALRSVLRKGGLDAYLRAARDEELSPRALRLKRQLLRSLAGKRSR